MHRAPVIDLTGICRSFAGVKALDGVAFSLAPGEVHALVGENGAGKSTLVKIIAGALRKDSGQIAVNGCPVEIRDTHHARGLGIGEIYQELMLVPALTVVENIFLGNERTAVVPGQLDWKGMISRTRDVLAQLHTDLSPTARIQDLSTAQQQMVEIAKALMLRAKILIFDEPTGSLTARNTEDLFRIIRSLRNDGVSMIYISHRLEELGRIADRPDAGEILLDGKTTLIRTPVDAVRHGIGLLTESRKDQGLVLGLPIRHNMVLPVLQRLLRWGRIDRTRERRLVAEQMQRLRIAAPSMEKIVGHLSGGNQQKVILAKWLIADCRVLIFDEPTRGVDVGAKAEIYGFMRELTERGVAIVVVSSDLPEILTISDRVLVMARGSLAGELPRLGATEEGIMALMVGGNGSK